MKSIPFKTSYYLAPYRSIVKIMENQPIYNFKP